MVVAELVVGPDSQGEREQEDDGGNSAVVECSYLHGEEPDRALQVTGRYVMIERFKSQ